ncbi:MAG TPA: peptide-methionine (S)-S-oxide reductase MsrA [Sphingobacteriaceae bacterium]|nr:peptide-methionine (S)-S-oxide reductase MsrA [Sphingobacteriaceae bacterium]
MKYILSVFVLFVFFSCNAQSSKNKNTAIKLTPPVGKAIAVFAEGCFWCSEHIFEDLAGVDSAVSGYTGGKTKNPTYEEVCRENTGHAEAVLVYYNPKIISYDNLLEVFFTSHDPTTLNRQGPDVGTSYRSAIFYNNDKELESAKNAVRKFSKSNKNPIVTQLGKLTAFYRAEDEHQNYVLYNPSSSYVKNVSLPRFQAFKRTCKLKFKKQ